MKQIIFIIFIIFIFLIFNIPAKIKLFSVQTGSMSPTIKIGAIVVVIPQTKYKVGDIITFRSRTSTTTHRIFKIYNEKNKKGYETKGDANDSSDNNLITNNLIIGKVIFWIPLIGYIISFAKTPTGFVLLILFPAVIIIYNEIINIKKEIFRLIKKN